MFSTRIVRASDAVYTTVGSAKQGAIRRVNGTIGYVVDTKNACVTKYTNTKNACITRYTNTKNACISVCVGTKNAVVSRYTNARDYTHVKYTNARNRTTETYRYWRYRKYTNWEKVKYSFLLILCLYLLGFSLLTARDVYRGDHERAQERFDNVVANVSHGLHILWELTLTVLEQTWKITCLISQHLYHGAKICLEYTIHGIKVASQYAWKYTKIAMYYLWEAIKVGARHIWTGCQVAFEYFIYGARQTASFLWMTVKVTASYVYAGACIVWQYFVVGCKLTGEYFVIGAQLGAEYTVIGSKLAAQGLKDASIYAYEHGSVALREGSIRLVKYLFYFLTNFRQASGEALVFLWHSLVWLTHNLIVGVKEGTVLLWHGTKLAVNGTYYGSIATANGVAFAGATTFNVTKTATIITLDSLIYGTNATWQFSRAAYACTTYGVNTAVRTTVSSALTTAAFVYNTTYDVSKFTYDSATSTGKFIAVWTREISTATTHFLRVAFYDYLLKWLYAIGISLWEWIVALTIISWNFLSELALMVANVLISVTTTIYNIVYIIVGFVYNIVYAVTTIIRTVVRGLVFVVKLIFKGVIWVLHEFVLGYLYALHKYNMYRELIFAGFVVLLSMYCSGLIRDRNNFESDENDFSDDEIDGDLLDFELSEKSDRKQDKAGAAGQASGDQAARPPSPTPRSASLEGQTAVPDHAAELAARGTSGVKQRKTATVKPLPPAGRTSRVTSPAQAPPPQYSKRGALPSYDDEHALLSSDDSDNEFALDQLAVPDFMNLSDSENEHDPTTVAAGRMTSAPRSSDISSDEDADFGDFTEQDTQLERTLTHDLDEADLLPDNPADFDNDSSSESGGVHQRAPEADESRDTANSQSETAISAGNATVVPTEEGDTQVDDVMNEDVQDGGKVNEAEVAFECDEFGNPV